MEHVGFEGLLQKYKSITVYKSGLQNLATEVFKSLNRFTHLSCGTFSKENLFNIIYIKKLTTESALH